MTEEQKKKYDEIIIPIKQNLDVFLVKYEMQPHTCDALIQAQIIGGIKLLAKEVFNKDITEEKAIEIFKEKTDNFRKYKRIEDIFWEIAQYFDFYNEELKLNLLILGQTGVGKSSLLNALVGKYVEKTGDGKPITQKGIFPHETEMDGKKVIIYDSYGLEVGKDKEWDDIIKKELKKRGIEKNIEDWFHSVTYCIQAGGNRIQDFDIKIIKQFKDYKYNVVIALTKVDQINEEQEREFIKKLKEDTGIDTVISVSANPQPKRGEKETPKPFGLPDYKNAILVSWKKIFIDRIPLQIISKLKKDIETAKTNTPKELNTVEHRIIDNLTPKNIKLSKQIKEYFQNILKEKTQEYITEDIEKYYKISDIILITSKSVEISNDKVIEEASGTAFSLLAIPGAIASVFILGFTPPFIIPATVAIGALLMDKLTELVDKDMKIEKFIDDICKEFIEKISKKEFENKVREVIKDNLDKIEKEATLKLPNLSQHK